MEQNKRFNIIKYNLKELQRKLQIMIVVDPTMTMAFELLWLYTGQGHLCPSITQKGPLNREFQPKALVLEGFHKQAFYG